MAKLLDSYWLELPDEDLYTEFDVFGCYTPGSSPVTYGPPESCDPGSPSEVEVERVVLTKLKVSGTEVDLDTAGAQFVSSIESKIMDAFNAEPSPLYEEYLLYLDENTYYED